MRARAVSVSVNVSDPEQKFSDPDNKHDWPKKNESRGGSRERGRKGKKSRQMKTLYVSDLDGTLLRSDERTSGYTDRVINDMTARDRNGADKPAERGLLARHFGRHAYP